MTRHRFTLEFKLIDCACGAERIRGVECPDCGRRPAPWEVDLTRQRRAVVSSRLLERLSSPPPKADGDGPLIDVPRRAVEWLDDFLTALTTAVSSDFRDVESLEAAVQHATSLTDSAYAVAEFKPFARAVDMSRRIATLAIETSQAYLMALTAETPLSAQRRAAAAQQKLDEMDELRGELDLWLERQDRIASAETVAETLWVLIAEPLRAADASSVTALAQVAQSHLGTLLPFAPDPAEAVEYGVCASLAETFLSLTDFDEKVVAAVKELTGHGDVLDVLFADPQYQSDLASARLELFDSGLACEQLIAQAVHLRQGARAVVELHSSLVEAAGRVIALPLLMVAGRKSASYAKLRQGNATEHLRAAQSEPTLSPLLLGLDDRIRTAQAHRAVIYADDSMRTDLKAGQVEFTYEVLVGGTFEALESVLACLVALNIAAAQRGTPLSSPALESLGLDRREICEIALRSLGVEAQVELSQTEVAISWDCASLVGVTPYLAGMLISLTPDVPDSVRVGLPDGTSWSCTTVQYLQFRQAADGFDKQLALMEIQAAWVSSNGDRWLSDDAFSKWVATQLVETMSLGTVERFRRMRALKVFAVEHGQSTALGLVIGFKRWARLDLTGQVTGDAEKVALEAVMAWASRELDFAIA